MKGRFFVLDGPDGGGKTTPLRVVLGLVKPQQGEVRVLGGPPDQARGRVGYVPQRVAFDTDFPIRVLDGVLLGRLAGRPVRGSRMWW